MALYIEKETEKSEKEPEKSENDANYSLNCSFDLVVMACRDQICKLHIIYCIEENIIQPNIIHSNGRYVSSSMFILELTSVFYKK